MIAFFLAALISASGAASYYGNEFEGRRTASGEKYYHRYHTAAHRTLPFGTWVRVRCGERECIVRINDRGPFVRGRVIDLSRSAAERVGLVRAGVAPVKVEVIDRESVLAAITEVRGEIQEGRLRIEHDLMPVGYRGTARVVESTTMGSDTQCWVMTVERELPFEVVGRLAAPELMAVSLSW